MSTLTNPGTLPAETEADPPRPRRHPVAEWAVTILLVVFGITALVQSFVIPTISMEETLLRGDHLLVDKLAYAPAGPLSNYVLPYSEIRRGDIIVFRWPIDIRINYVKRVLGLPGDRIRIADKQLYLNGTAVREPYKIHRTSYVDSYRDNFPGEPNVRLADAALAMLETNVVEGELVVPPGHFFVMGDNRDNSSDSRYWGFVPRANIIGKPLIVFWSYDAPTERLADPSFLNPEHLLDLARNFFRKTRWRRTFQVIGGYPVD